MMLKKRARFWLAMTLTVSLLSLSFACGGKKETADEGGGGDTTAKTFAPKGDEGTITGKVNLTGTPPAPQPIDMSQDANCKANNTNPITETVVAKDGKLANAFVYIKDGTLADGTKIGDYSFAVPGTAVTLDQSGCHYVPHVIGIQTNQTLKVTNSDPTTHNIHPAPKNNKEWNEIQASGAAPLEKTFTRAEVLIPVKCNQHPWMKSYIGVLKHSYFAVSKED